MFYYNVKNPIIAFDNQSEEQLNKDILEELMLKGAINKEYNLPKLMDSSDTSKSLVVPAKILIRMAMSKEKKKYIVNGIV